MEMNEESEIWKESKMPSLYKKIQTEELLTLYAKGHFLWAGYKDDMWPFLMTYLNILRSRPSNKKEWIKT
jgi:Leu/Phe-tRNA-protein transferase